MSAFVAPSEVTHCDFAVGDRVQAYFYTDWHFAQIRKIEADTVQVLWESEWSVSTLPISCVSPLSRHSRVREERDESKLAAEDSIKNCVHMDTDDVPPPPPPPHHQAFTSTSAQVDDGISRPHEDACQTRRLFPAGAHPDEKDVVDATEVNASIADEVSEFLKRWKIDAKAEAMVTHLPAAVRDAVLSKFKVKEVIPGGNPYALLLCYIRGILSRMKPELMFPERPSRLTAEQLESYAEIWHLSEGSIQEMKRLPIHKQYMVFHEFQHSGRGQTFDHAFKCFLLGRFSSELGGAAVPKEDHASAVEPDVDTSLEEFLTRWSLSACSRQFMLGLKPHVYEYIIANFKPAAHTCNVEALLRGYAASLARSMLDETNMPNANANVAKSIPAQLGSNAEAIATPKPKVAEGSPCSSRKERAQVGFRFDVLRGDSSHSNSECASEADTCED